MLRWLLGFGSWAFKIMALLIRITVIFEAPDLRFHYSLLLPALLLWQYLLAGSRRRSSSSRLQYSSTGSGSGSGT